VQQTQRRWFIYLEDFFVGADDQVVVDAETLAEFVDDHRVALCRGPSERMRLSRVVLPAPR